MQYVSGVRLPKKMIFFEYVCEPSTVANPESMKKSQTNIEPTFLCNHPMDLPKLVESDNFYHILG